MEIVFTAAELCRAMPPPGRYGAVIEAIRPAPSTPAPRTLALWLRINRPADIAGGWLVDDLILRGRDDPPLAGLRRLLRLLHRAGIRVAPNEPIDLDRLRGLEVWVDVSAGPAAAGYPFSRIVDYQLAGSQPAARTSP